MADGRSVAYELQPALERCIEFRADWILQMYARNLGLMLLVAGGCTSTSTPSGARAQSGNSTRAAVGSHPLHILVHMPWDRWLGSNHDGTPQAMADLQRRRRERMRPRSGRT